MLDRDALRAAVAAQGRVARVVVAAVAGSAPREVGASMLVWDGGQSGTIGGGALEWEATGRARAMLDTGKPRIDRLPLGPALGQCCGGAVTLLTEVWDADAAAALPGDVFARSTDGSEMPLAVKRLLARARGEGVMPAPALLQGWMVESVARATRPVWVWGAGHVGRAVVAVLAPLPGLAITWIDVAAGRFPGIVPDGVTALPAADPGRLVARAPQEAEHLVLTYSHALDLDLCHRLLGHGFARLGLIGSSTKRARFAGRLRDLGHSDQSVARIDCPVGDPSLGKHPQAIAVGVAAAMLRSEARGRARVAR